MVCLQNQSSREYKNGNELILTDVGDLDITDEVAVMQYVQDKQPEYIINCAAYTAVDKAEEVYELADKINGNGPGNLAKAAKAVNATLIHISTDYVFNGDLDISESYSEEDAVGPVTVYGKTKLHGEEQVKNNTDKYYIFRTAWLYGDGNNFVRTMLKLGKENGKVSVVADQHGSPTYAEDLANIIGEAIEKQIPYGLYHSTNQGFTTWYGFTQKIFQLANVDYEIQPVTSKEFVRPAKRPKNSQLNKNKLLTQGINIPTWEDGLKRYLEVELHK